MRVALCGPMAGYIDWNHRAFNEAATWLRTHGFDVFSPAEVAGGNTSYPVHFYMRQCIREVTKAEALITLPGWEQSEHAPVEVLVAENCGMPVWTLEEVKTRAGYVVLPEPGDGPDD